MSLYSVLKIIPTTKSECRTQGLILGRLYAQYSHRVNSGAASGASVYWLRWEIVTRRLANRRVA